MPTRQEISDQIKSLKIRNAWMVRPEVNELEAILDTGEPIRAAIQAYSGSHPGLLVMTSKRIIFVDKGIVRLAIKDFHFEKISSVEFKVGWAFGEITVFSFGSKTIFSQMAASETRRFAELLRKSIDAEWDRAPPTLGLDEQIEAPNVQSANAEVVDDVPPPEGNREQLDCEPVIDQKLPANMATLTGSNELDNAHETRPFEPISQVAGGAPSFGKQNAFQSPNRVISGADEGRKVSLPLGIGIALLPGIFVWLLIKPGYSAVARLFGFGWAAFLIMFWMTSLSHLPKLAPPTKVASVGTQTASIPLDKQHDPRAPWEVDGEGVRVTKAGFEARHLVWPLTVDAATIGCERGELLWVQANGVKYGLNGWAQSALKLDRFDDVWAVNDSIPSYTPGDVVRVNPTDLLNEARNRCV